MSSRPATLVSHAPANVVGVHGLVERAAAVAPDSVALEVAGTVLDYRALQACVENCARWLTEHGIRPGDRVAIIVDKSLLSVVALLACSRSGTVFVPINPALKTAQMDFIVDDCGARCLIGLASRLSDRTAWRQRCRSLTALLDEEVLSGKPDSECAAERVDAQGCPAAGSVSMNALSTREHLPALLPAGLAAILYTSGSTGRPKGVMLSQANLLLGAKSVAGYLRYGSDERLLVILPLSFDYGLNQLFSAFQVGACVVLKDYYVPRDVTSAVVEHRITGIAAVPPVWNRLVRIRWPVEAAQSLRFITNSGGAMPVATTTRLRELLPDTAIYLMYGLTEAFRSTFLSPSLIDTFPDSIGQAIPGAEVSVRRPDGSVCDAYEVGELVHAGELVALGYWNRPADTASRFRPVKGAADASQREVWSGDRVYADEDDNLFFVARADDMIKSHGYRISPSEVEEALHASPAVQEAGVFGIACERAGQAIMAVVSCCTPVDEAELLNHCRSCLPGWMVPRWIRVVDGLPKNPNGKIDRLALKNAYSDVPA